MNRRDFVRLGISLLGTTFLSSITGCSSDVEDLVSSNLNFAKKTTLLGESDPIKKIIIDFLEQDEMICYDNYPKLFLRDRRIFVINDYEFIREEKVLERKKIDYYIKLNVLAVLNSAFKIPSFKNKITGVKKVDENQYDFLTDYPGQTLNLNIAPQMYRNVFVPIRIDRTESMLAFDKLYRLPCFMHVKTFKNFTNKQLSIWQ